MKKRFLSVLTALTLCLTLLPTASLAAGTAPSSVTLAGTELESGKSYIPKTDGGIEETTDSSAMGYLTYDNGVLTVHGTVEVSSSAGLNFDDGTLTLAGDGDLTITASGIDSAAVSGSNESTLTTAEGFSGSITLQSVNGDAVQIVKLDLTTRGDIRISSAKIAVNTPDNPVKLAGRTVTIETTAEPADDATVIAPSLNVTAGGNVTITGSGNTYPLIGDRNENCAVTLNAGGNVKIVNKSGTAVHGLLTVAKAVDVAISGNGNTLFSSASITASGTVQMVSSGSNGVVYSGAANGLTITGAKTVEIAGEASSDPVVTGMTLSGCGTASVTRLGNPDSEAPIANTVTSDIPVLLCNGKNDIEPQLLWKNDAYQKDSAVGGEPMEPDAQKAVYYEARNGYVMFSRLSNSDPKNGAASAILFNAERKYEGIVGNLTGIEVIGENSLSGIQALDDVGTKVSFTGNGTLHTLFTDSVEPEIADSVAFHGLVCVMTTEATQEQEKPIISMNFTAYGTSNLPPNVWESDQDPGKFVVGTVDSKEAIAKIRLTVPKGATLTVPEDVPLEISDLSRLTNNGTLVNNSTVSIPDATAEDIKALNLTGSGLVQSPSGTTITYYTNEGAALGNLKVENLDLSQVVGDQGDLETDGYHWDNTDRTLTLNGLAVTGALDLPNGAEDIKIAVQKESFVNSLSHPDSYRPTVRIVGREPLTVQHMSGDIHLTLERDGALNAGEINIGAAGSVDSIITVKGKLTVKGKGIRCGQMVIDATGVLNVSGEQGVAVFGVNGSSDRYQGAFQIAKGGTFTANCTDYNVMVLTQGITMDEAKAKTYLVLPENYLPEGYSIQVATGDNGSDKVYAATVAKKGATLTLIAKRVDGAGGQLELKFQTAPKPGAGGGSADGSTGGGSSSGGGGGSSSSSKPSTNTGTTTKPDGTKVQTETKADGTKIQTETKKDGSTVKTTTNPNGSSVTETKASDGSTGTVKTDKNGQTTAETTLSSKAIEDAKKNGEAVTAPVQVEATRDSSTAPTVKVELPKNAGKTEVEIPVSNAKPGTVAVLVRPDGTEEILKASVSTENGIRLTVDGSATVKIVDNSKDFIDTRNHWAKDAIDFVSARELVNGMSDTIYAPNATATRAQLWTILARQNDADLNGGNTWYEKAQLWSKDKGISDGTQPDAAINRAQMVTMLWRTMGQPAAGGAANFNDVPANSYYAQAVAWAVEGGITQGVGGDRFDPNSTCTRAQIATFLYRYMK